MAATKRELVRIGLPATVNQVRTMLDAFVDEHDRREVILRHYNGSLIVEAPEPTFPEPGDPPEFDDPVDTPDDYEGDGKRDAQSDIDEDGH